MTIITTRIAIDSHIFFFQFMLYAMAKSLNKVRRTGMVWVTLNMHSAAECREPPGKCHVTLYKMRPLFSLTHVGLTILQRLQVTTFLWRLIVTHSQMWGLYVTVKSSVCLFVCLSPVKSVQSFATRQHLAASGGFSHRLPIHLFLTIIICSLFIISVLMLNRRLLQPPSKIPV